MRWNVAVTWESTTNPPVTVRSVQEGGTPGGVASRAIRQARVAIKGKRYASVLVLVEKAPADAVPSEA